MRRLTDEEKRQIAEDLLGSCMTTYEMKEYRFPNDDEIDDLDIGMAAEEYGVFLCECCGWWTDDFDIIEGEMLCGQCQV